MSQNAKFVIKIMKSLSFEHHVQINPLTSIRSHEWPQIDFLGGVIDCFVRSPNIVELDIIINAFHELPL